MIAAVSILRRSGRGTASSGPRRPRPRSRLAGVARRVGGSAASVSPSTSRKMNRSHRGHQRGRGTPPADAVDRLAGLAQPGRQPGEVAVAGDDREGVERAGVQQVHRVDDQRGVRGVLAGRVGELLDRLDGVPVQLLLPAHQLLGRPVAVGALDGRHAVPRELLEQGARVAGGGVVGVDQDGDAAGGGHRHRVPSARDSAQAGGARTGARRGQVGGGGAGAARRSERPAGDEQDQQHRRERQQGARAWSPAPRRPR